MAFDLFVLQPYFLTSQNTINEYFLDQAPNKTFLTRALFQWMKQFLDISQQDWRNF